MGRPSAEQSEINRFLRALLYLTREKDYTLKEIGQRSGIDPDELSRFLSEKRRKSPGALTIKKFTMEFEQELNDMPQDGTGEGSGSTNESHSYYTTGGKQSRGPKGGVNEHSNGEYWREEFGNLSKGLTAFAAASQSQAEGFKTSAEAWKKSAEAWEKSALALDKLADAQKDMAKGMNDLIETNRQLVTDRFGAGPAQ